MYALFCFVSPFCHPERNECSECSRRIPALFAFWSVVAGFKYVDAGIGALVGLLEIVFSILFGILIFKKVLSLSVGLGALFILIAAGLPHIVGLLRRKKEVIVGNEEL